MGKGEPEKWQKEIEDLLKEKFPEDELDPIVEKVNELFRMVEKVDRPRDTDWEVIKAIIHVAIENLEPLVLAYLSFQLGVAYEKMQNERRT